MKLSHHSLWQSLTVIALCVAPVLSCQQPDTAAGRATRGAQKLTPEQEAGRRRAEVERVRKADSVRRALMGRPAREVARRPRLVLPVPAFLPPTTASVAEQRALLLASARTAWSFFEQHASATGYAGAVAGYPYATMWDMASVLAAIHSAHSVGIITRETYRTQMDRALATLATMPRYDRGAFNKMYATLTATMVDRDVKPTTEGYGWSTLDHGRLLIWLRIIGNDPEYTARTRAIVAPMDMQGIVVDGYLMGQDLHPDWGRANVDKHRRYGEGRVGYEQYAAQGFALWGARAPLALNFAANGVPVRVNGHTLLADVRGKDVLTSEPFVMMGLELGWISPHWRSLALASLAAQEAESRRTGRMTIVSEDAVPDPPAFFYYYLLYREGQQFVVTGPEGDVNASYPRWVSAKTAYAYHALAPGDFTWRAVRAVQPSAVAGKGWTAGVYEGSSRPTEKLNLNTAAVVLESAAYVLRGRCPLIRPSCR